jgi:hypothetical protein
MRIVLLEGLNFLDETVEPICHLLSCPVRHQFACDSSYLSIVVLHTLYLRTRLSKCPTASLCQVHALSAKSESLSSEAPNTGYSPTLPNFVSLGRFQLV